MEAAAEQKRCDHTTGGGGALSSRRGANSRIGSHSSIGGEGSRGSSSRFTRSLATRMETTHALRAAVHHACMIGCHKRRRDSLAAKEGVSPVASAGQPFKARAGSAMSPLTSASGATTRSRRVQPSKEPSW